ncbi:plasmid recombination protein, partial [Deltaproteobacteria bacterium OttesenSCG-928-M10]|nr:plasmid recombination protein [Deltaproteobacteria bacterium OttesenSCG-928-M10]
MVNAIRDKYLTAFSIIRIKKLKSWGAVAGSVAHNARTRETLNANPAAPCRFLIGSPGDDPVAVCQARLGDQRIRKNAVYGVDGFLGASPEYFRPDAPGQYGLAYKDRLDAWVDASVAWLQSRYGDRVINAVLHLDEATPHIQYLILPLDDNGKLNCKAMFGGSKYVLSQLQSDYADAMAHLGLTRGRQGSKAKHIEVAEYYASTQNVEHTAIPQLPTVDDIQPPEPPSITARIKTENLIAYAKEAGVKAAADQMAKLAPALETLTTQNAFLITENAR